MGEKNGNENDRIVVIADPIGIRKQNARDNLDRICNILDGMLFFEDNRFVSKSDIAGLLDKDLIKDIQSIKYILTTWVVNDPDKIDSALEHFIKSLDDQAKSDIEVCEEYEKKEADGYKGYCDLVDRLIKLHGLETVVNEFGKYIRHRVPSYAFENLDQINVNEPESAVVFILSNYPNGFAKKYFTEQQIIKGLEQINEKPDIMEMSVEGVTTDTLIDYACRHGYLSGPEAGVNITEIGFLSDEDQYETYEDVDRAIVRWFVNNKQEIPSACVEALGADKVARYQREIELENLQQELRSVDDALGVAEELYGKESKETC